MFWDNKVVTLFNRAFDPKTEEEKYYLTVLEKADLVEKNSVTASKSGQDKAAAVTMYMAYQTCRSRTRIRRNGNCSLRRKKNGT